MPDTPASSGTRFPLENGVLGSTEKLTIAENGSHDDGFPSADVLTCLKGLKEWAEQSGHQRVHHVKITGQNDVAFIDKIHLEKNLHYEFKKGSNRSNLAYWCKTWFYVTGKIYVMIHINGKWVLSITPNVPAVSPALFVGIASEVIEMSFRRRYCFPPLVKSFESSRLDTGQVVEWLKNNNIREIKCYLHDNYEARVEVTYLDPPLSPKVSAFFTDWDINREPGIL